MAVASVNHTLPSGPAAMAVAATGNSLTCPAGVILPSRPVNDSVNHRLPSGPLTIASGTLFAVGIAYSTMEMSGASELPGTSATPGGSAAAPPALKADKIVSTLVERRTHKNRLATKTPLPG